MWKIPLSICGQNTISGFRPSKTKSSKISGLRPADLSGFSWPFKTKGVADLRACQMNWSSISCIRVYLWQKKVLPVWRHPGRSKYIFCRVHVHTKSKKQTRTKNIFSSWRKKSKNLKNQIQTQVIPHPQPNSNGTFFVKTTVFEPQCVSPGHLAPPKGIVNATNMFSI